MTKYEYIENMYKLALRMAKAKKILQGYAISTFYAMASKGFSQRMDEMSEAEGAIPATEEEIKFYKDYAFKVAVAEKEAKDAGY